MGISVDSLIRGGCLAVSGALLGQLYTVLAHKQVPLPILTPGVLYDNLNQDEQFIIFLSEIETTFKRVDYISYRKLVIFLNALVGIYTQQQQDVYSLRYRSEAYMSLERCKEAVARFRKLLSVQCHSPSSDLCPREFYRVGPICDKILLVAGSHMQLLFAQD